MSWIRFLPVTAEAVVMCIALFTICSWEAISNRVPFQDVQREWGAVRQERLLVVHDGVRRDENAQLSGPFDVWDGEWFRIPLTAFHHQNFVHLLISSAAALTLGRLLEPAWGSLSFGLFLVPAMFVSMMAEICTGNAVMGLSGAVCAMLGALTVLRFENDQIAKSFPIEASIFGLLIILLGVIATAVGVVSFANISHISGYVYGVSVATISSKSFRKLWLLRAGLILFHLWLIPSFFFVTHPFWLGRYQWYRAVRTHNSEIAEKCLVQAISCDPSLTGVWIHLSEISEKKADFTEAWKWLIRGMEANPSSPSLMDSSRRLWRHLDSRQRKAAEQFVRSVWNGHANRWMNSIRTNLESSGPHITDERTTMGEDLDLSGIALDQKIELPVFAPDGLQSPSKLSDPQNPHEDAAEGQKL